MKNEIQQPLKNPSGKCNLLDIGWTDDPAVGKDYPLKPMHMINEPRIELPEPPVGQKWEYRGENWATDDYCCSLWPCGKIQAGKGSVGNEGYHYWQAVDVVSEKGCSRRKFLDALERINIPVVTELTPEQESEIVKEQDERLKDEYGCEPQYRMLEEGEVIREGDEFTSYSGWQKVSYTVGYLVRKDKTHYRRPLSQLTDSQKLTLAIEALEKARGWTVAD
jgi:hypothetical protein